MDAARRSTYPTRVRWTRSPWRTGPRTRVGTSDIDIDVFVPESKAQSVLDALPEGVARDEHTAELVRA